MDNWLTVSKNKWPKSTLQWQGKYISSHQHYHSRASLEASLKITAIPDANTSNYWQVDDYLLIFPAHSTTTHDQTDFVLTQLNDDLSDNAGYDSSDDDMEDDRNLPLVPDTMITSGQ